MASQLVSSTQLCFPSETHGPVGSVPPEGMMMVFLPAAMASRTSIQVIFSSHTVSVFGSGFGVSLQLNLLAEQSPPPIDLPSSGVSCANAPDETATVKAAASTVRKME